MVHAGARDEAHHRLLEGFLLRLARQPEAPAFVLRGGMLVRRWLPALGRPAEDVDLVCSLPLDLEALGALFQRILSDGSVQDGVTFDAERAWLRAARTERPGAQLRARGRVDGQPGSLTVDLAFALPLWPEPVRVPYQVQRGADWLWTCRPETLLGRKLQVLTQLGRHWRPKDLHDVRLLLGHLALDRSVLGEAIEAAFQGSPQRPEDAWALLEGATEWGEHRATGRWLRFAHARPGFEVSLDLEATLGEIRASLRPFLRSHP